MNRMIKDHSGSWMLSSGILTLYALAAYFGKTPGCNKSLCLSYGEQGRHSVYFAEDEVADSVRVGYEFVHDSSACGAYETEVAELLHRMERFVEETSGRCGQDRARSQRSGRRATGCAARISRSTS